MKHIFTTMLLISCANINAQFTIYNRANTNNCFQSNEINKVVAKDTLIWVGVQGDFNNQGGKLSLLTDTKCNNHFVDNNLTVKSLNWYEDEMYASTYNGTAVRVWKYTGIQKTELSSGCNFILNSGAAIGDVVKHRDSVWVATYGGLVNATATTCQRIQTGLNDYGVRSIEIDEDDTLWVGTSGRGIAKYLQNGSFQSYSPTFLENKSIVDIKSGKNGKLFLATQGEGLVVFDKKTGVFSSYKTTNSCIPTNSINALTFDAFGGLWLATPSGLVAFNGTNCTVWNKNNSNIPSNLVTDVFFDTVSTTLWVATVSGLAKGKVANPTGLFETFVDATDISVYPNPAINQLNIDVNNATKEVFYSIRNLMGEDVLNGNLTSDKNMLDVSSLPKGLYVLKIAEWCSKVFIN